MKIENEKLINLEKNMQSHAKPKTCNKYMQMIKIKNKNKHINILQSCKDKDMQESCKSPTPQLCRKYTMQTIQDYAKICN